MMSERDLIGALRQLEADQTTSDADWRDLYETIEAYRQRCLARRIVASRDRDRLIAAIKQLAGVED